MILHMDRFKHFAALLTIAVILAWPCPSQSAARHPPETNAEPHDHVIRTNHDGMAVDVDTGERYGAEELRLYVNELLRKAEAFSRTNQHNPDGTVRVTWFDPSDRTS